MLLDSDALARQASLGRQNVPAWPHAALQWILCSILHSGVSERKKEIIHIFAAFSDINSNLVHKCIMVFFFDLEDFVESFLIKTLIFMKNF